MATGRCISKRLHHEFLVLQFAHATHYRLDKKRVQELLDSTIVQAPLEASQTFHDDPLRYDSQSKWNGAVARPHACLQTPTNSQGAEHVGKDLEGKLSGKHVTATSTHTRNFLLNHVIASMDAITCVGHESRCLLLPLSHCLIRKKHISCTD
jgi:hypothetical protein